jgi:hypothetical protein
MVRQNGGRHWPVPIHARHCPELSSTSESEYRRIEPVKVPEARRRLQVQCRPTQLCGELRALSEEPRFSINWLRPRRQNHCRINRQDACAAALPPTSGPAPAPAPVSSRPPHPRRVSRRRRFPRGQLPMITRANRNRSQVLPKILRRQRQHHHRPNNANNLPSPRPVPNTSRSPPPTPNPPPHQHPPHPPNPHPNLHPNPHPNPHPNNPPHPKPNPPPPPPPSPPSPKPTATPSPPASAPSWTTSSRAPSPPPKR